MALPRVSVIVPAWNAKGQIELCLAALDRQTYPRDLLQVLVIDNGSTDGTAAAVADFAFARLLSEPEPGSYKARNTGLAVADGRYVAFTDADCVPAEDWLARAVAAAERHPEAGVISGRIDLFRTGEEGSRGCELFEQKFAFQQEENARTGACMTANWLSERSLIEAFGGFNADLKSGGDVELSRRLHAAGHTVRYAADMVVGHPTRASFADLASKRRRVVGGLFRMRPPRLRAIGMMAKVSRDAFRMVKKTFRQADLSPVDKLRVAGVICALNGVALAEVLRLAGGAEPRRS